MISRYSRQLKNKQKLEQLIPQRGQRAAKKQVLSITSPQKKCKINHTAAPPPLHKNVKDEKNGEIAYADNVRNIKYDIFLSNTI